MIYKVDISETSNVNECLSKVFQLISLINENNENKITLDLRGVECASPCFVVPLAQVLNQSKRKIEIICSDKLKEILFPQGLNTSNLRSVLLKAKLRDYSNRELMPLIIFPTKSSNEDETSKIIFDIESEIYSQLKDVPNNIINGLRYVIGEIIDNITQHSLSQLGYFYSKINRRNEFIEIAIADDGIGLLGSYLNNNDIEITSDIEALQAANRGISTKNLPNAENRGFGIITSKKMIIEGLKGIYIMISGNAMLLKSNKFNQYLGLSPEIKIGGTSVIFRMPLQSCKFNYVNYLE